MFSAPSSANVLPRLQHLFRRDGTPVQQRSTWTAMNRYPDLFGTISNLADAQKSSSVLSFGCASGEELETLDRLYLSGAKIDGVDVNFKAIKAARRRSYCNNHVSVFHARDLRKRSQQYDIILALSVLCRWPETKGAQNISNIYPFESFSRAVIDLDSLLRPGGHMVVFNANYRFEDTETFRDRYKSISTNTRDAQFVERFSPNGSPVAAKGGIVFQKIKREGR